MSTLAYGWVECFSDVAGCGVSSSLKYKYSLLFHLCNYIYCFMRNYEHVECWNVYVCFRWMLRNYASLYDALRILLCIMFKLVLISTFILVPGYGTIFMYVHDHGAVWAYALVLVASSSPVRGSRTWQRGIRAHVAAWACMYHQGAVTEVELPSMPSRDQKWMTKSFHENFSKCWIVSSSEHLVEWNFNVAEELEGSVSDGGQLEGKLQKISKCWCLSAGNRCWGRRHSRRV